MNNVRILDVPVRELRPETDDGSNEGTTLLAKVRNEKAGGVKELSMNSLHKVCNSSSAMLGALNSISRGGGRRRKVGFLTT